MNILEAKAYLGDKYVLSKNYRPEQNPNHNLYEPVNVRLTFAHLRHGADGKDRLQIVRAA
jgi:hypothetical protein